MLKRVNTWHELAQRVPFIRVTVYIAALARLALWIQMGSTRRRVARFHQPDRLMTCDLVSTWSDSAQDD